MARKRRIEVKYNFVCIPLPKFIIVFLNLSMKQVEYTATFLARLH